MGPFGCAQGRLFGPQGAQDDSADLINFGESGYALLVVHLDAYTLAISLGSESGSATVAPIPVGAGSVALCFWRKPRR